MTDPERNEELPQWPRDPHLPTLLQCAEDEIAVLRAKLDSFAAREAEGRAVLLLDKLRRLACGAKDDVVEFDYVNHRGESGRRQVQSSLLRFGVLHPYHAEPQWLLEAFDTDREKHRTFAVSEITLLEDPT